MFGEGFSDDATAISSDSSTPGWPATREWTSRNLCEGLLNQVILNLVCIRQHRECRQSMPSILVPAPHAGLHPECIAMQPTFSFHPYRPNVAITLLMNEPLVEYKRGLRIETAGRTPLRRRRGSPPLPREEA